MENREEKKLKKLIKISWFILFVVWLACIISGKYLNIVMNNPAMLKLNTILTEHIWVDYLIRVLMYYFQTIIVFYAIHKRKMFAYKPIIVSLMILSCWILKTILINIQVVNYIDLVLILSFVIFDFSKWKRVLIGLGLTLGITLVSSIINNLCIIDVDFIKLNTIIVLYFSIDIYIMAILYYLYSRKEVIKDGQLVTILQSKNKVESRKHCFSNITSTCNRWYRNFISDLRFNYCSIIFFIITYGSILIIAYFYNRMLEITIGVICFHIFRKFDEKTFHASTDVRCWLVSLISFWIIIELSLPLEASILSVIILSYLLTKAMYYIQDYIDLLNEKKLRSELKPLENLSIEELKELYSEYSLSDIHAIYMCLRKGRDITFEYIALKHNMTRMTLYRIMKKVKEKYHKLMNSKDNNINN